MPTLSERLSRTDPNEQAATADVPKTAVTLSFGGVDFCLEPESGSFAADTLLSLAPSAGNDLVINLASFTGRLRIAKTKLCSQSSVASAVTTRVEDDPNSPRGEHHVAPRENLLPGQQQLSFVKASKEKKKGKKKQNSAKDTKLATPIVVPQPKSAPLAPAKGEVSQRTDKRALSKGDPDVAASKRSRNNDVATPSMPPLGQLSQLSQTGHSQCSQYSSDFDLGLLPQKDSILSSIDDISAPPSPYPEQQLDYIATQGNTQTQEVEDVAFKQSSESSGIQDNPPPSPRWGHTMTSIDDNRIIIYGGQSIEEGRAKTLSDIHVYDTAKNRWYKPVNCDGVSRQWHTATFLPDRQLLISLFGESPNLKTGRVSTTDQVMVLDTDIMLWYPPSVSGQVPSGRSGHSATFLPDTNALIVFGGVRGSKWQNSVALLDINRWHWSTPKIHGDAPRPRSYHTATAISENGRSRLVIIGGNDCANSFNTVHVLETDGKGWMWSHPKPSGAIPSPRTGHSSTLLDDDKTILVYGGWDPNMEDEGASDEEMLFEDSFLLDTSTWTWRAGPTPAFADSKSAGVNNGGTKRVGHKATLTNGKDGPQVLVFGGRIPNDQFACDFQTLPVPQSTIGFSG